MTRSQIHLKELEGSIAIVTGASRGIGLAISRVFTANRINVYMISRNKARLNSAAQHIRKTLGVVNFPVALPADMTNEIHVRRVFSHIMRREGHLDILVNNAGIGLFKQFLNTTIEELRNVFRVNVEGAFLCCKEAFNIMKDQKHGCIVNMGSILSLTGYVDQSAYTAS